MNDFTCDTAGVAVVEGMLRVQLDVRLAALGAVYTTRLSGHDSEIRLPGPPAVSDGIGLSGGDLTAPSFDYFANGDDLSVWIRGDEVSTHWGQVYMRKPSGGGAAVVRRCALAVLVPDSMPLAQRQEIAEAVFKAVDEWTSLLKDWLETAYDQTLGIEYPPPHGLSVTPWMWTREGEGRVNLQQKQELRLYGSSGDKALDASALQQVLNLTGNLQGPPLAWTLQRDAYREFWVGDYRRAVLDAGTAAELALYKPLNKQSLGEKETLGTLVEKAEKADASLVVLGAQTDLVEVRNDAAHRGLTPGAPESVKALAVSAHFVECAWPRSSLLRGARSVRGR